MELFCVEASRLLAELRRYKLNSLVGLLDVFLLCLGIFLGTGREFFPEGTLFYALVGMVLWRCTVACLQTACDIVQKEIRLGTLEQLLLAQYSLLRIVVTRLLAKLLVEAGKLALVSAALVWLFRIRPDAGLRPLVFVGALALCLTGTVGIGCLVAGVALVYKKAGALVNSVSYFTLFFTGMIVPAELLPGVFRYAAAALPFFWCVGLLRGGGGWLGLLASAAFWTAAGVAFFRAALRRALADGATARY